MKLLLKMTLLCAAFGVLASSAGCRRVVILNFNGEQLTDIPDRLVVDGLSPVKDRRELSGLQQTLGYYDVSTATIRVYVQACRGMDLLADGAQESTIVNDEVTFNLAPITDPTRRCKIGPAKNDAGTAGSGGEGVGGGAGSSDLGQGGAGVGGAGGMTTSLPDAGQAGDGGTSTDTAECGTDTHAPAACEPPTTGDPIVPVVEPTADCVDYCARMFAPAGGDGGAICQGIYSDIAQCQTYCTLVKWPLGPANDTQGDTIRCREFYIARANTGLGTQAQTDGCQGAGPSSGGGKDCGGSKCQTFCHAWSLLCGRDETTCMTTCSPDPTQVACRFQWLAPAASDARYCQLLDLGSACGPTTCTPL